MRRLGSFVAAVLAGAMLIAGDAGWCVSATDSQQIQAPEHPLILLDQVGYDTAAPKFALIQGNARDRFTRFTIIDAQSHAVVFDGVPRVAGTVDHWRNWHYWTIDFSPLRTPGRYEIRATGGRDIVSFPFRIADNVLGRYTLSNVIYYFKGQRVTGDFARVDAHLKNPNPAGLPFVDLTGGWYDATGDYSVYIRQTSLVTWSLVNTFFNCESYHDHNFSQYERRLLDEATYGADSLVRMRIPNGSFYSAILAPGKGKLAKNRFIRPNHTKQIVNTTLSGEGAARYRTADWPDGYEASFGSGGGLAIAALAEASMLPGHGNFSHQQYLDAAKGAFAYLELHDDELLMNGKEGVIGDSSALLAATELWRATHDPLWKKDAATWAGVLTARLTTHGGFNGYWRSNHGWSPFESSVDDGMPVVALVTYASIVDPTHRLELRRVIRRSLDFQLRITSDVNNPFGYARKLVQMRDGSIATKYFSTHDGWWQGEDARLASLAAAARIAAPMFTDDQAFQEKLRQFSWNQLHWILGRNPYNTCMLMGSGSLNTEYMFYNSWEYTNAPGAIVNGITAGLHGEDDGIAFDLGFAETGDDSDWRWSEQWLPHAAWYIYAISLSSDRVS